MLQMLPWLMMGAGALAKGSQANRMQKEQKEQNIAASEQTRYSPWSGMGAGQLQHGGPSALEGAIGGGLQGLSMAQSLENSKLFDPASSVPAAPAVDPAQNMLGSNKMVSDLGQMGQQSPWMSMASLQPPTLFRP